MGECTIEMNFSKDGHGFDINIANGDCLYSEWMGGEPTREEISADFKRAEASLMKIIRRSVGR